MRTLPLVAGLALLIVACSGSKAADPPPAQKSGKRLQLVYDVDVDAAVDRRALELRGDLEGRLAEQSIAATVTMSMTAADALTVTPADPTTRPALEQLVSAGLGDYERRTCAASADPAAICVGIAGKRADAIRKATLQTAVATIRERLVARKLTSATVVERAGQIVVEVPAGGADEDQIRALIARGGRLELKVVDDGSQFMRQMYAHVAPGPDGGATEPGAVAAGVSADIDQWQVESSGAHHIDYYLVAHDREAMLAPDEAQRLGCRAAAVNGQVRCQVTGRAALERYLAELAMTDPDRFRLPDDREIGYERVEPEIDARDARPYWRTYYLARTVELTGAALSNAEVLFEPDSNRPVVLLELDRAGTRTFGELTERIVGRKMATILDDRIASAPIINDPIRGGRASIAMGGSDPKRQEAEARELADVLKSGSLPAPLQLVSQTIVP